MALKNQKLHQQFSAEASSSSRSDSSSQRPIFEGVSIFVDGYTVPSSQVSENFFYLNTILFNFILLIVSLSRSYEVTC